MKRAVDNKTETVVATSLVILFAVVTFADVRVFWGINIGRFVPEVWVMGGFALIGITLIPRITNILNSASLRLTATLKTGRKTRQATFLGIVSAAMLTLFLLFPSVTTLLGDGTLRKNQILDGQIWLATEPLDFLVHSIMHQAVFEPLGLPAIGGYQLLSALAGVMFIIGAYRLAAYVSRDQSMLVFFSLLCSGMIVLFFGYVESYSFVAAALPWLFLQGLKVVDGRAGRLSFLLLYLLTGFLHTIAAILFAPALVVVWIGIGTNKTARAARLFRILALATLAVIALAYLARVLQVGNIERYIISVFPTREYAQGILTINHWLNLINWLLLSALPLVILLPGLIRSRKNSRQSGQTGRVLFALWVTIPSVLFLLFFVPQLGGPRDWDLFSLPAFLLIPSGITVYLAIVQERLPNPLLPVLLLGFLGTGSFAAVNSNLMASVSRFEEIIEVSRFKGLHKEYGMLVSIAGLRPEIAPRKLEFLQKMWRQSSMRKADSVMALNEFTRIYQAAGDQVRSKETAEQALAIDGTDINNYLLLDDHFDRWGTSNDKLEIAEIMARRFSSDALGLMNAGTIFMEVGDTTRGGYCLREAFERDSTNFHVLQNYAVYKMGRQQYALAISLFQKAIDQTEDYFLAHYYLSYAYARLDQKTLAVKHYQHAAQLATTPNEKQILSTLSRIISP